MNLDTRTISSRRHFLASQGMTLGPIALAWLLQRDGVARGADPRKPNLERPVYDLKPKSPPKPPRARAMISMFMQGGPSHIDLQERIGPKKRLP